MSACYTLGRIPYFPHRYQIRRLLIFSPAQIATIFLECVDKSAIAKFRRFIAAHPGVRHWMVAADFSTGKSRPYGCFAFTIVPCNALLSDIERDAVFALPKDLKESRSVPPQAISWLRDPRRFHIAFTVRHNRNVFAGLGDKMVAAKDYVQKTWDQTEANRDKLDNGTISRVRSLFQQSMSRNFNVRLLGDIWLMALFFACITVLIGRESRAHVIDWFPDRDDMTNWCGGIWHDFSMWHTRALADAFDVDLRQTRIGVGLPDRSTGQEIMWFDYLLRSADWLAGAAAEWDRASELEPAKHPKYRQMWEAVIAGADNVVVLHLDIDCDGAQFRRIDTQPAHKVEQHQA